MSSDEFKNQIWNLKFALVTGAMLLALWSPVRAQQPKRYRIGYLSALSRSAESFRIDGFLQGLRDLGYAEDKGCGIEYRFADGQYDRLPQFASELVSLKMDVIVTTGPTSTRAAKAATRTIPIVMAFDNDPVGNSFVASLAQPGGNITGLSTYYPEISGKQLELLKEIVPNLSQVVVFGNSTVPGNAQALREIQRTATASGTDFKYVEVRDLKNVETAFREATKTPAAGAVVLTSPITNSYQQQIVTLAVKSRIPAVYATAEWVNAGGLLTYGANLVDLWRRAATYVDKILKGAKPADLPVEQPKKFEFIINLKAAKQIGLTIPPNVLARADRVIR